MTTATGFQQFVNNQLPPAVAGDFAGANIRASVQAPPGGFVAAPNGLLVGHWAWGNPANRIASNYYQLASGGGFVHRENNALITTFLGNASMTVLAGTMATLMNQGDYWGDFPLGAAVGNKVYADPVTGALSAAATGQAVTANSTAASVATTGIMTVGATLTGTLAVGQYVYATGIPVGSYISAQLTGSAGGTGTYQLVNINGLPFVVVSSTTINMLGIIETPFIMASNVTGPASVTGAIAATNILTVSAVGSGALEAGQFLAGTVSSVSIPANVQILSQITAVSPNTGGGTGTYLTNAPAGFVLGSGTIVASAGTLGKFSSWGA